MQVTMVVVAPQVSTVTLTAKEAAVVLWYLTNATVTLGPNGLDLASRLKALEAQLPSPW